jgi:peptide/nickel transport system substrate-binding protein
VLLKRFDGYRPRPEPRSGYAGAKQAFAKYIRWDVIPDAAAARAALYSGQIDIVTGLQPSDLGELSSEPSIRIFQSPSIEWLALLLNTDGPVLKNKLVREAIAHAIDYRALAKGATFGKARANPSVISTASPYHDQADEQGYTYDPNVSRRLLRQAGYRGEPILLQANKRYPAMFDNAIIVQSMLRKVGLNVRLEVLEWGTQLANVPARRFQLMSFGFSGRPYPLFAFQSVLGAMQENPWMQWQNKKAMKLGNQAATSPDVARRAKLFDSMHRLMLADIPMINLYGAVVIDAVSDRISGYDAWSADKPRLWGVAIHAPSGPRQ